MEEPSGVDWGMDEASSLCSLQPNRVAGVPLPWRRDRPSAMTDMSYPARPAMASTVYRPGETSTDTNAEARRSWGAYEARVALGLAYTKAAMRAAGSGW